MKFGPINLGRSPVTEAEGAILAHTAQIPGGAIKKGHRLTRNDITRLTENGYETVIVAILDNTDVPENAAAARIAAAIAGPHLKIAEPFTGRVNIFAEHDGLARINAEHLIALNQINEGLTVATLKPYERVNAGQMIATIKIIPFALPEDVVATAESYIAAQSDTLVSLAPFTPLRAHLILTELPGTKSSVVEKRRQALLNRLISAGSTLSHTETVPHDETAVAAAIDRAAQTAADLILVFGASAIVDRRDVIPAAIEAAGGIVHHLGMPVDPGNLLLLGKLAGRTIIGVPSCANSPKINGLDWVLERTLANLAIISQDLAAMAVGGLLMEIQSRPQPREQSSRSISRQAPKIAAIILAAGRSTRMGAKNKLLEKLDGRSLVRHAADAASQSRAEHIYIVIGHEAERVREELGISSPKSTTNASNVTFVPNTRYADGLATSLFAGLKALPNDIDGAIVLLGDMPGVTAQIIDRLIAAFAPGDSRGICVPNYDGQRGNPVLWARRYFGEMKTLQGDAGAKALLGLHSEDITDIAISSDAILADVDTPEALAQLRTNYANSSGK